MTIFDKSMKYDTVIKVLEKKYTVIIEQSADGVYWKGCVLNEQAECLIQTRGTNYSKEQALQDLHNEIDKSITFMTALKKELV